MKYSFVIILITLGICHGLFGSIGQAVNNLGNTANQLKNEVDNTANKITGEVGKAVETTGNAIGQLLNIVNGVQFSAKFLWETVFNPTFDLIIQSGQAFLNGDFGAVSTIVNTSVAIPANPLSDKYAQLTTIFKSNIQHLYSQLFLLEQEAIKAIEKGEVNFEERLDSFKQKIEAIKKQMEEWADQTKNQLEAHALTLRDDLEIIVDQYKQNIDLTVQSMEKIFENITKSLVKNFLDFVQNVIPNARDRIANLKNQTLIS